MTVTIRVLNNPLPYCWEIFILEETKEVICVESITGKDAMSNHIGNCLPHYAQMLGCGVVMKEIICVCDPTEVEWWKASLSAWQAERFIVMPNHCP